MISSNMVVVLSALLACLLKYNCALTSDSSESPVTSPFPLNPRPIIGVLAQELPDDIPGFHSYIATLYVHQIEASGARVVPIMIRKSEHYYQNLMSKLNGVLFPGGNSQLNVSGGYSDAARTIYNLALQMNTAGDFFPLFGTCLGFQLLAVVGSSSKDPLTNCDSFSNLPIESITPEFYSSRLYRNASREILDILTKEDVTVNSHHQCFVNEGKCWEMNWRTMSYNHDKNGLRFISSFEHKMFPFYGTQFHPEKPAFQWTLSRKLPHSLRAIQVNRHFMDFFVEECRRNQHRFNNTEEENQYLVYKYTPYFTKLYDSKLNYFEQCYLFKSSD